MRGIGRANSIKIFLFNFAGTHGAFNTISFLFKPFFSAIRMEDMFANRHLRDHFTAGKIFQADNTVVLSVFHILFIELDLRNALNNLLPLFSILFILLSLLGSLGHESTPDVLKSSSSLVSSDQSENTSAHEH